MTHLGSGSDLFDILSSHPNIEGFRTGWVYDHPERLTTLVEQSHKRDNAHAIYMDELPHNYSWSCKALLPYCKFIFYVRSPDQALSLIMKENGYTAERAARHYCYRLRGLYEYLLRIPEAPVLTWQELKEGLPDLEGYLRLKTGLVWKEPVTAPDFPVGDLLRECRDAYGHYLSLMQSVSCSRS